MNNFLHFKRITVSEDPLAQDLLSFYKKKAYQKGELERIHWAQQLCSEWKERKISTFLFAVPERQDYWYLVQLYFMDRHVRKNLKPYVFDWKKEEEIYICDILRTPYARENIEAFIKDNNEIILKKQGLNTRHYRLSLIPYDIYIRLSAAHQLESNHTNIHFDGYRLRTDRKLMGLFGGSPLFGGSSFIDSLWIDIINQSILTQLVIIRKDYGY